MAQNRYEEVFYPGNWALVSNRHDELVGELKALSDRLAGITRQERAILRMAVDLLDYMKEYALDTDDEPVELRTGGPATGSGRRFQTPAEFHDRGVPQ